MMRAHVASPQSTRLKLFLSRLLEKIEITPRGARTLEFCCEKWIDEHAPTLQLFEIQFENVFIHDDAGRSVSQEPTSRSLSLGSAPPRKPLPALPFCAPPPGYLSSATPPHQSSSSFSSAPPPAPQAAAAAHVPSTAADCRRVFESRDVDALTNLFGRASIELLRTTFSVAEEKQVVELLGLPVKQSGMLEKEFITAIQQHILSKPKPSSSGSHNVSFASSSHAVSAPVHHPAPSTASAVQDHLSITPPPAASNAVPFGAHGSGRKDKVDAL